MMLKSKRGRSKYAIKLEEPIRAQKNAFKTKTKGKERNRVPHGPPVLRLGDPVKHEVD